MDLHLSISNGFVSSKIYDKRDDFDFDIVNFPFLDGDILRSTSYGVYISQLIQFARVSSHVADFNARNKSLTAKLLQQGYLYHKLRKTLSKFYRRHFQLVSKFNVGLNHFCIKACRNRNFMLASLFNFTPAGSGVRLDDGPNIKLFILVGLGRSFFVCCLALRGSNVGFLLLQCSSGVVRHPGDLRVSVATRSCRVLIFASS